ncbi:MAG: hypothetical protein CL912_13170 [Deltaproteobacteria bacterium]|nr:hypothetical protein [Deltaproteobacteria bacterium]|tara:strand:- start:229 stop:810 length:582 start_codon:yes stop_codon:yes gene_type:complete
MHSFTRKEESLKPSWRRKAGGTRHAGSLPLSSYFSDLSSFPARYGGGEHNSTNILHYQPRIHPTTKMASPQPVAPDVPPPNSKPSSPITTSPMSETVPTLLTMPSSAETNIPPPVVASSYQAIEHLDPSLSEKLPVLADKSTPSKPSSTSPSSKLKISTPRFGNLRKDRDQANDNQGSSSPLAEALVDMPKIS